MTEEQYMQLTIQLSSHRTIFQWLRTHLGYWWRLHTWRRASCSSFNPKFRESYYRSPNSRNSRKVCIIYESEKLLMDLRMSPCLRATLDGDWRYNTSEDQIQASKEPEPLGIMMYIKQTQLHATKDYNPCFSPTGQISFRRMKKKVKQFIKCFTNIRDYIK